MTLKSFSVRPLIGRLFRSTTRTLRLTNSVSILIISFGSSIAGVFFGVGDVVITGGVAVGLGKALRSRSAAICALTFVWVSQTEIAARPMNTTVKRDRLLFIVNTSAQFSDRLDSELRNNHRARGQLDAAT